MLGFHVRIDRDGDAWTLSCGGELDISTAPRLDEAAELCFESRPTSLYVDCRDVTFIDSSGLSALLRIARSANEEGVPHNLVVSDQVLSVVTHAGLLERLLLGTSSPAAV